MNYLIIFDIFKSNTLSIKESFDKLFFIITEINFYLAIISFVKKSIMNIIVPILLLKF